MLSLDDTIVAIATSPGQGGIGIVRLSGPRAIEMALSHFTPAVSDPGWRPKPRRMYLGHISDITGSSTVDQVLLCVMPSPRSYTRQDVAEIHAHGGMLPLRTILSLCLQQGARLAEPGEFTLRAFVNGRIDLAQAEAVADVICAQTTAALRIAQQQLEGHLSERVRALRRELMQLLAYLQARTDFPDDDIPERDILPEIKLAQDQLANLLSQAGQGIMYRQGVRTAIVGRPNVGKSSLLNRLLGVERAIVTAIPGTTRDTLSETIDLQGIPLVLVDTAGISSSTEPIEALGIERSRRAIAQADLVLLVVDGSLPPSPADAKVAALVDGKQVLLILNKCDLTPLYVYNTLLPFAPHYAISALNGEGITAMCDGIVALLLQRGLSASSEVVVSNPRHQQALAGVQVCLASVHEAASQGIYSDLITIDLVEALRLLGEITGETASDELLTTIFHSFCIGK